MSDSEGSAIVLVIEEDQELRDGIASLLTADGYQVISARDEEDAFLRTKEDSPNFILASVNRSEKETIRMARQVRNRINCPAKTPIVIFSVTALPEGAEMLDGEETYLTRPDDFNQLRGLLRRLNKL